jgi:toluene monooxygenase system protein E
MSQRQSYWHLEGLGREPSPYEIATSRLLYYVDRGFEVSTPISAWYAEHQRGSALQCQDAEAFRDPRATTYASYTSLQREQESHVDELLASIEASNYDRRLSPSWVATLAAVLPPLRYPVHGLQMIACYVGHMAPAGRVVVACALQAADEIRRIQRLAYRTRQLQELDASFGADAAALWQRDQAWQPLRELIERLLVTYDWGEALVALNVVVKPALDDLFMARFAQLARAAGDDLFAKLLGSLQMDCCWHHAWTDALITTLVAQTAGNAAVVTAWTEKWRPAAMAATAALEPLFLPPVKT